MACAVSNGAAFQVSRHYNSNIPFFSQHMPDSEKLINGNCKCEMYCHENVQSVWYKQIDLIRENFQQAMETYIHQTYNTNSLLNHNITVDGKDEITNVNVTSTSVIPFLPDVTIHFRCSDILTHQRAYGFLNYHIYSYLIPIKSKYIYVVSDSPSRGDESKLCGELLSHLFDFLRSKFPDSIIYIKRGGNLMVNMIQIMHSQISICSASTFCLWPAIAAKNVVYYPTTELILNATNPYFAWHFHWIVNPTLQHKSDKETMDMFIDRLKTPLQNNIRIS
eukprot:gene17038-23422_t